ncbi:MAG TPA: hypothetical protein VI636_25750 [Candidatus Angelobacter sp.]
MDGKSFSVDAGSAAGEVGLKTGVSSERAGVALTSIKNCTQPAKEQFPRQAGLLRPRTKNLRFARAAGEPELEHYFSGTSSEQLLPSAPIERAPRSCIFILTWVSRSDRQGLTQKHPSLEHLYTNPGWQVIAELPGERVDEALELQACCP